MVNRWRDLLTMLYPTKYELHYCKLHTGKFCTVIAWSTRRGRRGI